MTINQKGRSVLLVGSVPLSSAQEVFEAESSELGPSSSDFPMAKQVHGRNGE